jgi:hypothetical protein
MVYKSRKKKIAQFSQKPLVSSKTVRFYQKSFGFPFAKKKHDKEICWLCEARYLKHGKKEQDFNESATCAGVPPGPGMVPQKHAPLPREALLLAQRPNSKLRLSHRCTPKATQLQIYRKNCGTAAL